MSAIQLLKEQHSEVEKMFDAFEAGDVPSKRTLMMELCDALAAHATIEERHFYPAVRLKDTEGQLQEAVREHLEMKRIIAELIDENIDPSGIESKVEQLKREVLHHVEEEESELLPKVQKLFTREELAALREDMENTYAELMAEGEPSKNVPAETDAPAPLE